MLSGQGTGEVLSPSGMHLHVCHLINGSPLQTIRVLELNELSRVASELRQTALTDSTVVHTVVFTVHSVPSGMHLHVCHLINGSPLQAIRALELNELRRVASELRHTALTDSTIVHTVVIYCSQCSIHQYIRSISHPKRASVDTDPTDSTAQEAVVESGNQNSHMPLGEDLVAGHVHVRQPPDTDGSDASPRIKRRLRGKTSLAEIERQERGRSRVPEPPRLRTLNQDPAHIPIPEGSLVPCSSPISGQNKAHPYTPVGNAVGSSSFEVVPSVVDRAASERGLSESMETIPILRSSSSPSILHHPSQVMSPNLVAGSASNVALSGSGIETDAGAQAILQQWQEVKTEHGTVERTYTQCAQTWPLGSSVKLESIESAILILRQACDYLHNSMTQLSSITDRKCDTEKVQQVIADLMTQLPRLQATIGESSQGVAKVTSRVDELSRGVRNTRS